MCFVRKGVYCKCRPGKKAFALAKEKNLLITEAIWTRPAIQKDDR